jgi:hypothetical protein
MKAAARIRVTVIVFASLLLALANYCWITAESSASATESYFAARCPTDDTVIAWFHANKKTLGDFLNMVAADDEKITYVGNGIVEVRPGTVLPETRKQQYLSKLRETGAASFNYQRNEGASVSLWTDAISTIASITKICRYKDVHYIENINKWHYAERLRPTLDGLETNGLEGIWLRHIEGKWYIVYMKD